MFWFLVVLACLCGPALGVERSKAGGVSLLFRQLEKDNDPGIGVYRERSGPLQLVVTGRFQFHLDGGFLKPMLDGGLGFRSIGRDALVGVISHIQQQLSVLGN